MSYSKSFLKWAGGKHRVVEELTNIVKENPLSVDWTVVSGQRYHEPFLGSGAMFFGLRSNGFIQSRKKSQLNDINEILIGCMRVVSDEAKLEKLLNKLKKLQTDYSRQERNPRGQPKAVRDARMYYVKRKKLNSLSKKISSLTPNQEIELAALAIFLNKTCYNGLWRMNRDGDFNVPEGDYDSPTNICQESILRTCQQHLSSTSLSSSRWEDTFRNVRSGDLVYLDPPYMPLEIDGATFTTYFTDGFSRQDQIELATKSAQLAAKGARVIASNHDALGEPTVREIYGSAAADAGCRIEIRPIQVGRNISCKGHGRVKVNEVLIFMTK